MEEENYLVLEMNGFIMNAGILGFLRLLDQVKAIRGVDYEYNEYQLKIKKDYLRDLDLAQAYIDTANDLFYKNTHYYQIKKALDHVPHYQSCLDRESRWTKEEKQQFQQRISDVTKQLERITSLKSLTSACRWLQNEGVLDEDIPSLIKEVKKCKDLKNKIDILLNIKALLEITKVKETLCLVGVSLKVLSHFWVNKAFIKNSQGNIVILSDQNMKTLLEAGVVQSFKEQLEDGEKSDKVCLDCGDKILKKSKPTNLSFMNDMADDVAKKPSAFWNFDKNLAVLCDKCTFLYLLMPLGFKLVGQELVFVNANSTTTHLKNANKVNGLLDNDEIFNWSSFCQQMIKYCIKEKDHQSDNIQVVIRTTEKGNQRYRFEVLSYDSLRLIAKNQKVLEGLAKFYSFKMPSGEYWNVCEDVISKLLNQSNLYSTLQQLLRMSLLDDYEVGAKKQIPLVYQIQLSKQQIRLGGDYSVKSEQLYYVTTQAKEAGASLRSTYVMKYKKDIGGVVYRLLNSIQTNNKYEFLNTVLRLHTSYGIQLSPAFMKLLNEPDYFKDMGYAYVMGLQGHDNKSEGEELKRG